MKALLRDNKWFFAPYVITLSIALYALLTLDKGHLVLFFNRSWNDSLETLATVITYLGDGITATVICVLLAFMSKRVFFTVSSALVLNTLIIQSLKALIDAPRPRRFFEGQVSIHDNQWVDASFNLSMPSGHTALAFCLFALLAFFSVKKANGYSLLWVAIAVGLSRIALAQHFLADIVAGSFLGVIIAITSYVLGKKWMPANSHFDKPLIAWKS